MRDCEIIIQEALKEGRPSLLANEAQQICDFHNIPTPKSVLTSTIEEAVLKAKEIGFPVTLKIVSPQIIHKSDVGGVILDIKDEQELKNQYNKMITDIPKLAPTAKIIGVLVSKMMPSATEVIIGAIRDSQFGPSVMFGIGGIFTEIYNDVAFRVAPIEKIDALNLIHDIKGSQILEGVRGRSPANIDAIVNILLNVSDLMMEHDRINQLDLNPIMAYSDSACAVDTRIVVKQKNGDE
ncbi:MAG TPA: acetate--CoA ligase family protein [Candidatus Sulfotelmatobacter sp.]|nr:acetate--CoA ligase family protein [Candidatus Sulfotelmatobacter sp.]